MIYITDKTHVWQQSSMIGNDIHVVS